MGIRGGLAHWEAEEFGVELIDLTVGDLLDLRANEIPDKEAIVYNYPESGLELRLNYRQYNDVVNRLAKGLMALGVEKGDHIAVWATNVPEWIFLEMALAKIGAVLVIVNTNYKADEIEYVLRQGDISMLFMIDGFRNNSYLESIYSILPEIRDIHDPLDQDIRNGKLPELRKVVLISSDSKPGMLSYSQVLDQSEKVTDEELKARQATVSPYDVAQMQYTSGTTGFPKGVMITHHSLVNQSHVATTRGNLRDDERNVSSMPLFHVAGCLGAVIYSVYLGCTLIPLVSFDPLKQLELFEK
ncbi:MAG: AMP-binding protein, partial [Acidobacteria bacterium]|nr:AMP-binding protein [Acidobacteriota bacterium]